MSEIPRAFPPLRKFKGPYKPAFPTYDQPQDPLDDLRNPVLDNLLKIASARSSRTRTAQLAALKLPQAEAHPLTTNYEGFSGLEVLEALHRAGGLTGFRVMSYVGRKEVPNTPFRTRYAEKLDMLHTALAHLAARGFVTPPERGLEEYPTYVSYRLNEAQKLLVEKLAGKQLAETLPGNADLEGLKPEALASAPAYARPPMVYARSAFLSNALHRRIRDEALRNRLTLPQQANLLLNKQLAAQADPVQGLSLGELEEDPADQRIFGFNLPEALDKRIMDLAQQANVTPARLLRALLEKALA